MMQQPILHALTGADLGQSHSVADALPHLAGMLVVITALMALWGLTVLIGKLVGKLPSAAPVAPVAAVAARPIIVASAPVDDSVVSPEIAAVIAAAVTVATAGTRQVISVRQADSAWERAGRHSILTSHRIR